MSLDYLHVEIEAELSVAERWDLGVRVPFDLKRQRRSLSLVAPATEPEREAMLRNMNLHHRSETYAGFSDLMLLVANRRSDQLRSGDALKVGFGITLPTGRTEPNPYQLAAAGRTHLHIQFGSGTVDPLLELNYRTPAGRAASVGAFVLARIPVYENGKTYRGPRELTSGLDVGYRIDRRLLLRGSLAHYYQGYAEWGGDRDENSGLYSVSAMVGAALRVAGRAMLGADVRQPIRQRTLSHEGDAFTQGPTFMLRLSREARSDPAGRNGP